MSTAPQSIPFTLIVTLLLTLTAEARADYNTLLHEFEGYQPPVVLATPSFVKTSPTTVAVPADQEFREQVSALRQQQQAWAKSLRVPQTDSAFLIPDPALMEALRPAAGDISVTAQTLAGEVRVEALEILVLLRSPSIQAKERELQAVLEGYSQAEALDSILRRYASFTKSVMTGVGGMSNPDPVVFKFPFPGVLALKGEVVGQEAEAARQELEATRREALTAIRRDHAELRYLHQAVALTRSQLELLTNLRQALAGRYEADETSFQELTSLAIEQEKVKEELSTLREEQKNREAAIRAALSLPDSVVIGIPATAKATVGLAKLDTLAAVALDRRQEIRAKKAMIGRAERLLELAETMTTPGFSQELSLFEGDEISRIEGTGLSPQSEAQGITAAVGSFPVTTAAASGLGLPKMPWFGSDDAYLRQTRVRIDSLKKELEALSAATILAVRNAWFEVDKAQREMALYRERVLPLAKASLDAGSQSYATNRSDFPQLINSAKAWLQDTLALARAETKLQQAQAELSAAVGVDQLSPADDRQSPP